MSYVANGVTITGWSFSSWGTSGTTVSVTGILSSGTSAFNGYQNPEPTEDVIEDDEVDHIMRKMGYYPPKSNPNERWDDYGDNYGVLKRSWWRCWLPRIRS